MNRVFPGGLAIGLCLLAPARAEAAPVFEQEELRSHDAAALLKRTGEADAFEVERVWPLFTVGAVAFPATAAFVWVAVS
jgi:hypothetical protein